MLHTFGKTITDCCLATGMFSLSYKKELELVEEAKKYHLNIVGVSSTKKHGSGIINLDGGWKLFYSGADPSMSTQAGVEFSQALSCQTVCLIEFLWDYGSVC